MSWRGVNRVEVTVGERKGVNGAEGTLTEREAGKQSGSDARCKGEQGISDAG